MHVLLFHSHTPVHVYLFIIELDYFTKSEHNNLIISIALINHIKMKNILFIAKEKVCSSKFTPSTKLHHLPSYSRHKQLGTNRWHLGGTG